MPSIAKRVFIVQDPDFTNSDKSEIIPLPNPSTGEVSEYLICNDEKLFEIQVAHSEPSSWFIGQHVESNGSLHLASKMDPLFILLHILDSNAKKKGSECTPSQYVPLGQLLCSPQCPLVSRLLPLVQHSASSLCDVNDTLLDEGILLVRFSDEKANEWLGQKLNQIVKAVEKTSHLVKHQVAAVDSFNLTSTSTSSGTQSKRTSPLSADSMEVKRIALQILSSYISIERLEKLANEYRMNVSQIFLKSMTGQVAAKPETEKTWEEKNGYAKSADTEYLKYKMQTSRSNMPEQKRPQVSNTKTPPQQTKKQRTSVSLGVKRLAKVDTRDMKSITSFFGKPKTQKK